MNIKRLEKTLSIVTICVMSVILIDRGYNIYTNVRVNQNVERSEKVISEQERQITEQDKMLEQLREKIKTK